MKEKKKCVFAGTFDPPTLGHQALIEDCLAMFDEVVVAILINPQKQPVFTLEQRTEMLRLTCRNHQRVKIVTFAGTVAELLKREETPFYVRGIRNTVDFEYENANFFASKKLNGEMVAIYLPCSQELLHVSSSIVRNSLRFQTPITDYVTKEVEEYIYQVFPKAKGDKE